MLSRFTACVLVVLLVVAAGLSTAAAQPPNTSPGPSNPDEGRKVVAERLADPAVRHSMGIADRMDWWREARFGMFIHWGLYAIPAGEWGGRTDYGEWIRSSAQIPREEYDKLQAKFNPEKFDARAWVKLARGAGMKYITITTKHHDGFCLFDSKETDWDVMNTPFKRDIIKEMAEACREEGVTLCFYYSIMDWHHPDYTPRRDWETGDTTSASFDRYIAYMKAQLKELLTNYGPIGVLWFDGQWEGTWNDERGADLEAYVRSLQPGIIINSRVGCSGGAWGLDGDMLGDYATPEQTIPDEVPGGVDWETCMTMNGHWGYNRADKNFKTTKDLVQKLADIASKGGNFLLNVGPTAEGEIPGESIERLKEIGAWMTVNAESIHGTRAGSILRQTWGRCTERTLEGSTTTRLYLHMFDLPSNGTLAISGVLNAPRGSHLLCAPDAKLVTKQGEGTITIELPKFEANRIDDVVVLDIEGRPDVMRAPTITAPSLVFVDQMEVGLATTQDDVDIRYTLDGAEPRPDSPLAGPVVHVKDTGIISARSFRNGKPVSPVSKLAVTKVEMKRGSHLAEHTRGVNYEYFQSGGAGPHDGVDFKTVTEFAAMKPVKTGRVAGFDLSPRVREKHWGMRYKGYLEVSAPGVYRFATGSDDASRLWIGSDLVVDNDMPHSYQVLSGDIALAAGFHEYTVEFFENTGGFDLKVFWTPPGAEREPIPTNRLWVPAP